MAPTDLAAPATPTDVLHRHRSQVSNRALKQTAARGARWVGLAQVGAQVLTIGSTAVLARLLTPADFGTIAVVSVVIQFVSRTFGDTGTGAALVQRTEVSRRLVDTTFAVNLAVGLVTSVVLFAVAGPLADLLVGGDGNRSAHALRILAAAPAVGAAAIVPRSLLRRQMRFKLLALASIGQAASTAGGSILLAVLWDDYRALVVGSLAGTVVYTVVLLVGVDWWPSWRWSWREFRSISKMSRNLTIFNFFGFFTAYGDRLVVARIGLTQLGYYGMANRIMRYPLQTLTAVHREVAMPSFATLKDDNARLARAYVKGCTSIATVLFPVSAVVAVMAEPLVVVGLGERWRPAAGVVALIAVVGGLQAVANTTGGIYVTKGRTDLYLWWAIVAAIVTMAGYWIGSNWGATGVAWGFLGSMLVLSPIAIRLAFGLMKARTSLLYRALTRPLLLTVLAAAAAAGVRYGLEALGAAEVVVAVVASLAGFGAYVAASARWNQRAMAELISLLRPKRTIRIETDLDADGDTHADLPHPGVHPA